MEGITRTLVSGLVMPLYQWAFGLALVNKKITARTLLFYVDFL